ncbi:S46 family peptidase [Flaviaesturariibacter aridisoli]|uniref:Dipeptidyl-peptidase n=1 Tax=Flaviaesturariibacter aridisoli TaxID=2545761 RepID=A0A4V2WMU1_9BACT|nr:S46 family peptidase [Flaviaesturariibacter aridisoli]TCZ72277.1 S46 family peptidase [Flaviaesturariibacter aridisoli]
MKRLLSLALLTLLLSVRALADEGMWLPQLLQTLNEKDMKKLGLKLKASDIYSINKSSLKDAIVSLGGFCTAEVISTQGLLLTNHHCGFDAIQNHSTLDHNYIRDGFWSKNNGEELPNPGLTATFIVRIDDVTTQVLSGITPGLSESERTAAISRAINSLRQSLDRAAGQDVLIRPFFEGNKYYAFVTETYKDIRLVGAPPSSIGNFGKDTDNWMWPRHTGDFSLFRIYTGPDGRPADYSPANKPMVPKRSLSISLDGVTENDFTMVFGFPGRTNEYLPASGVQQLMYISDPARIGIREKALSVLNGYMRADEGIRIQYASKYAGIENSHKKWKGELLGLQSKDILGRKRTYEAEFQKRVNANPKWKAAYGTVLTELDSSYSELGPYAYARDYYNEVLPRIELLSNAQLLAGLVTAYERGGATAYNVELARVRETLSGIFGEYNATVDRSMAEALLAMYVQNQKPEFVANTLASDNVRNDVNGYVARLYGQSYFDDSAALFRVLSATPEAAATALKADPALQLQQEMQRTYQQSAGKHATELTARLTALQRTYMKAQMEVFPERRFYPDANSTLRVTYGKAKPYQPRDGVTYGMYTYLDGVMEKYVPGDYEFDVPQKLRTLYAHKDFGQYGANGRQPVCFIGTNHTTGGNSGSPVLDASGNLVGLNFDRVWEGTMSDIAYDPDICRNIMVDIRYVCFIIDKYAGATNLISELKFVHPKKGMAKK